MRWLKTSDGKRSRFTPFAMTPNANRFQHRYTDDEPKGHGTKRIFWDKVLKPSRFSKRNYRDMLNFFLRAFTYDDIRKLLQQDHTRIKRFGKGGYVDNILRFPQEKRYGEGWRKWKGAKTNNNLIKKSTENIALLDGGNKMRHSDEIPRESVLLSKRVDEMNSEGFGYGDTFSSNKNQAVLDFYYDWKMS